MASGEVNNMKALLPILFLAISVLAKNVRLEWDANTEENISGYNLSWGPQSGNYTNTVFTTNITVLISNVPAGETYFAVKAIDTDGAESDYSLEVSFTNAITNKFIIVLGTGSVTQGAAITEILKAKKWEVLNRMEGIWLVKGEDVTSRVLAEELTRSPAVGAKVKLIIKILPDGTMTHWGNASKDMWTWMALHWGKSG